MATLKNRSDRRIQRTQQGLRQAFIDLMLEKGFAATSIQDITERANVNRGTFYIHYADKYELLDSVMRDGFQQQLATSLPPDAGWDKQSLKLLIQAVLETLDGKYRHQARPVRVLAEVSPLLEQAMQEELTGLLLTWLKRQAGEAAPMRVPLETMARVVSWAIFGTALQWSREPISASAVQVAEDIFLVITQGVAHLAPNVLP